jgi:hypothetical protein
MTDQDEPRTFTGLVVGKWTDLLTAGRIAAALGVFGLLGLLGVQIGTQLPVWIAVGLAIVLPWVVAIFMAGRDAHEKARLLTAALKPKLEIIGTGPITFGYYRVKFRNLTATSLRVSAKVLKADPPFADFPLPVSLKMTHEDHQVAPHGEGLVDVLIDKPFDNPTPHKPGIILEYIAREKDPEHHWFRKDQRREFLIEVFTEEGAGASAQRWFYMVPQQGGGITFTSS